MKNKTIKLISILAIILILASQTVFAASEKPYTVELKNGFEEVSDGVYVSDGNGFVFIIESEADETEKNEEFFYSKDYLNAVASTMQEMFTKDTMKSVLLALNLEGINEENVDEIVNSMEISIKKKEVTTFSKNNYKCLHFVFGVSIDGEAAFDEELYATVKGDNDYVVMDVTDVGGNNAVNELVNSFTFVEKEEPKTEEPKSEEVKEEPKSEEAKPEVKEETKSEEAKTEVKEETKSEEKKSEEVKSEEVKDTTVKEGKLPQTGVAVSFEAIALSILSLGTALYAINNKRK